MNKIIYVMGVNSRMAGGLFFTITSLVNQLTQKFGKKIAVLGFQDKYSAEDIKQYESTVELLQYSVDEGHFLRKIGYSHDLRDKFIEFKPDIIHQQGLWMFYSKEILRLKKQKDIKVLIQPHGMLDPWALRNSYLKKKIVGFLYENNNLHLADCFHALNLEEYKAIRDYGLKQPVAVIANGININVSQKYLEENNIRKSFKKRKLLYLGRIHPKKGIELIVDAIKIIHNLDSSVLNNWIVQIAGWDQSGHQEYLQTKIKDLGVDQYFEFVGSVFGHDKENAYLEASGFILPSYSEGLPMTILEAWSYNLPVIMTKFCNIEDGFTYNAAIEIVNNSENIAERLLKFLQMDDVEKYAMGKNGYQLVEKKYTWNNIAEQVDHLYNWLQNPSKQIPNFVILD